ncbi:MAG: hypothetical protein ACLPYS_03190 [Vulcanimicrobiaceae bacterium]
MAIGGWFAIAVAFAIATRWRGSSHAADHVLLEAYGPLLLPLLAYAIVGGVVGAQSLSRSAAPFVAFGASPARAAAAAVAVAAVTCMVAGALLAAGVDVLAHGSTDPPLLRDSMASAYAGGLGGGGYAAWFMLGASFGKRGGGRPVLLVVDWVLGASDGAAALATPRGHLRNLLGGMPPMDLPERASAAALLMLAIAWALVAIRRAR